MLLFAKPYDSLKKLQLKMLLFQLLIYAFVVLQVSSLEIGNNTETCFTNPCFHQLVENCPLPGNRCRCKFVEECQGAVVCCNVTSLLLSEGLRCAGKSDFVTALHIHNATIDSLNLTSISTLRRLEYLSITDGNIKNVIGEFGKNTYISCLNLSSNGISEFKGRSLSNLYKLKYLDLSHNNISEIPSFKKDGKVSLDISDNPSMECTSVYNVLDRSDLNFININTTFCLSSQKFQWFNSVEIVALTTCIELHRVSLSKNCLKNCTCAPERLNIVHGKSPVVAVSVNCSGMEFLSLPTPLPMNTISLNISNNNLTSLKEINDPSYQNLKYLYADNNQITSIQPLEGSTFTIDFMHLSLRNNNIKTLETYVLSNIIFDRNYPLRQVNLSGNHLHCDCNTAKDLKVWLLTKTSYVPDHNEIRCENLNLRVLELNLSKLCLNNQQDWTDYIYYIITVEVLMLVGLVAKVSYDYWVFKTAGYLPWPASKMPKLPCDWLCE